MDASHASHAPWQVPRATFHAGQWLHGSAVPPETIDAPRETRPGTLGFFTTTTPWMADFYANHGRRNAVANQGDIYVAAPPTHPLVIATDAEGVWAITRQMAEQAKTRDLAYLDGHEAHNPRLYVRATANAIRAAAALHGAPPPHLTPDTAEIESREWEDSPDLATAWQAARDAIVDATVPRERRVRHLDAAWNNVAFEHNQLAPRDPSWRFGDLRYLRQFYLAQGYDAVQTVEPDPLDADALEPVTVYFERPPLMSHRAEVTAAVERGDAVPPDVLADYPALADQVLRAEVQQQRVAPNPWADPTRFHRWRQYQPPERLTLRHYQERLGDLGGFLEARDRTGRAFDAGARTPQDDHDTPTPTDALRLGTLGDFFTHPALAAEFADVRDVAVYFTEREDDRARGGARHCLANRDDGTLHRGATHWIEVKGATPFDVLIHEAVHAQQAVRGHNMDRATHPVAHQQLEQEAHRRQQAWWTGRHANAVAAAVARGAIPAREVLADYPGIEHHPHVVAHQARVAARVHRAAPPTRSPAPALDAALRTVAEAEAHTATQAVPGGPPVAPAPTTTRGARIPG